MQTGVRGGVGGDVGFRNAAFRGQRRQSFRGRPVRERDALPVPDLLEAAAAEIAVRYLALLASAQRDDAIEVKRFGIVLNARGAVILTGAAIAPGPVLGPVLDMPVEVNQMKWEHGFSQALIPRILPL